MHPIEHLGWTVCADPMTPEERAERVEVLRGIRGELRANGEHRLLCHVQMCLAVHELFRGDWTHARQSLDEALSLADPDKDRAQYLTVMQVDGTWWLHAGNPGRACEAFSAMVKWASLPGTAPSLHIKAILNLGYTAGCMGDLQGAMELFDEAERLAINTQVERRIAEVRAAKLVAYVDGGQWAKAADYRAQMVASQAAGADIDARALALLQLFGAALDVRAGRISEARAAAEAALQHELLQTGDDQMVALGVMAEVALAEGNHVAAVEVAEKAYAVARVSAHGPRRASLLVVLGRALAAVGRLDDFFERIQEDARTAPAASTPGRRLREVVAQHFDQLQQVREVELQSTNEALRRLHASEAEARALAERAASARHRFLSAMSHELRTPLTGVMGAMSLLEGSPLSEAQANWVGIARRSATLTLQIIDDILDLGRLEAGRLSLDLLPFSISRAVSEVLLMVAERARKSGVVLQSSLSPALPTAVRGDDRRLRQVLLNLVANAVKFAAGGTVQVRVWPLDGAMVRFEVQDDGIGIPESVQATLFDAYIQADARIGRTYGGSGLGLSISRGIVEAFQGKIGVCSRSGVGSTFWFEVPLPVVAGGGAFEEETGEQPVLDSAVLSGVRVLLAEDNDVNRQLVDLLLQRWGADVRAVEDGVAAVSVAGEWQPDFILMDMHMPRMNGLEATRHLRALGFSGAIVALTAAVLPEDRVAAASVGMDGFATKPIQPARLLATLSEVLTKKERRARPAD